MSEEKQGPRIVQIVSAERGWHVSRFHKDPKGGFAKDPDGGLVSSRYEVVCWGLDDTGEVHPMITDEVGITTAIECFDDGDFDVLSPPQSWKYGATPVSRADKPLKPPHYAHEDAEIVATVQEDQSETLIVWRWV